MLALGIGFVGVVLPLIPTVPLILLAAFCFARSSTVMHDWLVDHRVFGPSIRNWRENGAISLKGKRLATVSIVFVIGISVILGIPTRALMLQLIALGGTLLFIWKRPSGPKGGHPRIQRDKT